MKSKLNITVDEHLAEQAKRYAEQHKTSVSQLVQGFFKSLTRPSKKKSVLDLMETLPPPPKNSSAGHVKEDYYRNRSKKYGF